MNITRTAMAVIISLVLFSYSNINLTAAPIKDMVLFYLDGESLTSGYKGVTISQSIRLSEGKFGSSLLIERRTLNLLADGDLAGGNLDAWITEGKVELKQSGGIEDSACLSAGNNSTIALPLVNIKTDRAYAFSFYTKAMAPGKVSVDFSSGMDRIVLADSELKPVEYTRQVVSFVPKQDFGTLRINVTGEVLMDNFQLEEGATYANTFSTPLKMRGVDCISVPAEGGCFNPEQGAISCWINAPWLENREFTKDGVSLFSVGCKNPGYTGWGANTVLNINAWPKSVPDDPEDWKGKLFVNCIDTDKNITALELPLNEIKPNGWHHLVFNWKHENGQMAVEVFVDGTGFHLASAKPYKQAKTVDDITIGFSGGSYLDGRLDDFAIFSNPLSQQEVLGIYSSGVPIARM